ncbi:MAG: hypothetical protein WD341_02930 [Tistlia sp.]|uniref:hypothetical protein n=1 Tax=Tistlia sp. TaxID=3057121 RepID=UPI0034A53028
MRTILMAAPLLLALGGCALPPALSIASLVLDAGSYAASGKSVADHGISLIAEQDCALLNLVSEGAICRETPTYDTAMVAALEPLPGTSPLPAADGATQVSGERRGLPFLSDGLPRSATALRPVPPATTLVAESP